MTAHATPPAAQPPLAGLDLPEVQALDDAHVFCCIHGQLDGAAKAWLNDHGEALLEVHLQQRVAGHPKAVPIVATLHYTSANPLDDFEAARAKALQLPHGAAVMVLGFGLQPGTRHGEPVLRLLHCRAIDPTELMPGPATRPPVRSAPTHHERISHDSHSQH